jgi:thiol-disulfide isomerase/thioredoxin
MEKMNLVSDIIKISLKFDNALEKEKFCNIQHLSDKLKSKLRKLKLIIDSEFDESLCDLCEKLSQVNEYAINLVNKNIKTTNLKSTYSAKTNKNILLFFYAEKCQPSVIFSKEWEALSKKINNKISTISINCTKHPDMCNQFNIYEYPTVKYATESKIIDYNGQMTADEISKEFNF